jgi:hypothetical protein
LIASATLFAIDSSGGGLPTPRPQGAACDPQIWTYTVSITSSELLWDRCDVSGSGTAAEDYTHNMGSRILSAAELDTAKSAARMVHVSNRTSCGADKPTLHMVVNAPSGAIIYGDDFYACRKQDNAYVEGASLDSLQAVLQSLVLP